MDDERAATYAAIDRFLAVHTTMTLATVGLDGAPAAAAVFYAHDERLNLYFLSEESTQHGQNVAALPMAAATVHSDGQDWRTIRGLQVRGEVVAVPGPEVPHAVTVYGRKYAFVGAQLVSGTGPGVLQGPLARARFYVLRPVWLRLLDNSTEFGHKDELTLVA